MPSYTYKCIDCEKVFDVTHSMSEKYTECVTVGCDKGTGLVKILRAVTVKRPKAKGDKKIGSVVKHHIEEARQEVEAEKKRMQQEEYKTK